MALHAREGSVTVADFRKGDVKLPHHRRGDQLAVVVAHVRMPVEIIAKCFEPVAEAFGKLLPEFWTP